MKIGIWELVVIFVIALMVIGPDKFPAFMGKLGKGMKELKKAANEVSRDFQENVAEPLNEAQKPLREALEPFSEMADELKSVEKTMKNAAKPGGLTKPAKEKSREAEAEKAVQESAPVSETEIKEDAPASFSDL